MAQTFNTILSFVKSTSRKDRRKGVGSLSVSAVAGGGVGSAADSATQAWVRDNFVDKTTEQEITALKIFSQGIKIGDVSLFKHPDGYVYLDETLVLKGGAVMYGNSSGVDVPSIFDSLPIDGETIKRDGNGALYVDETALSVSGGGSGGGVADSVHWNNVTGKPSWIGSTKPTYKYSEIEERPDLSVYAKLSDIPSLNGYATQSWVEGKGYLLATTASNTYQTKITSSSKLAYSLISDAPDLGVYALKTAIPTKLSQLTDDVVSGKYLPITGGTINGSITATLFIGNLTGNADSATKLATARTIWGQSFDGTKNIVEPPLMQYVGFRGLDGSRVGYIGRASTSNDNIYLRVTNNLSISATSVEVTGKMTINDDAIIQTLHFITDEINGVNGTGNAHINYSSTGKVTIANGGGNVAIGGTAAEAKLHVHGDAKATLFKSAQGYTLTSSATTYCGLIPNKVITTMGNATDFWLYNTTDIKYYATKHIFLGDNVAIGDTTAEAKLHVHGTAKFTDDTTFSSKVVIGTIPVYESVDGTLYVDANIVFRGGVAMYGDTTTTVNEE